MKTNVYIDGFNFYYRCVQGSPYKWLDLAAFSAGLLKAPFVPHRIRYYTAKVASLPDNPDAPIRQQIYLRALATLPNVSVTYGHFLKSELRLRLVSPQPGGPLTARVLKFSEKGSDVNLATDLLLDAFKKDCDAALIISCDSDLLGPVRAVKREFGMKVGLAMLPKGFSTVLTNEADFIRHVRPGLLKTSQFPVTLTDAQGTISKPATW
jgi:uncharacterized LabA/DUF88 family protein